MAPAQWGLYDPNNCRVRCIICINFDDVRFCSGSKLNDYKGNCLILNNINITALPSDV